MRRFVLFVFFVASFIAFVEGQDFLVTVNKDTINCKLGNLHDNQYPISFVMDDNVINGYIHKDSILFYKKNVFRGLHNNRIRPWYPLMDIGLDFGIAYQFGKFRIDDDLTNKSDFGARMGFIVGADMTFYVSKTIGYGFLYNYRSLLNGDINYNYIGPSMAFRFWNKERRGFWFLMFSAGCGWIVQKNAPVQLAEIRPRIEMHANTIAGDLAVGYNFRLSKYVSARVKLSGIIGYPGFVKIMDVSKYVHASDKPLEIGDYCNNMNTLNLSIGLTFHK